MGERGGANAARGARRLGVAYLVWQCCSSLATIVLLARATLAYAGVLPVAGTLYPTTHVLGLEFPVWVLLALDWPVVVALAALGITFGLAACRAASDQANLGRTVLFGRCVLVLCAAELLLAFVQASAALLIGALASAALAVALTLEVRRCAPKTEHSSVRHSLAQDALDTIPAREPKLPEQVRPLFRLCSGYATVMLVWGALRVLMGLSLLFANPEQAGSAHLLASGLIVIGSGVYLIVTGRLGKRALATDSRLRMFVVVGAVGLALSIVALVGWLIALHEGLGPGVVSTTLDVVLYGVGCFYAHRLRNALSPEPHDAQQGPSSD